MSEAQDRIIDCARRGEQAVFVKADDPVVLPKYDDQDFWAERSIKGDWLAELLTKPASADIHRRGIRVLGVRITDGLDLEAAELTRRLELRRCQLGPYPINLREARTQSLLLTETHCGSLVATVAQVTGNVLLDNGFNATGEVNLSGASIAGDLDCSGGQFTNHHGPALSVNRAHIAGKVFLSEGFKALGQVSLIEARINSQLGCRDGQFHANPHSQGVALCLASAQITGDVFLDRRFKATGEVRLVGAIIGGELVCSHGKLRNSDGEALSLYAAQVTGGAFLDDGFAATGRVSLDGARIGGQVVCRGGKFANPGGDALSMDGAQIARDVVLDGRFEATGEVSLRGTSIGGSLHCGSRAFTPAGEFSNPRPHGLALAANRASIGGDVFLNDGFKATELVSLLSATIGGKLDCTHGNFTTLLLDGAKINGDVVLANGFTATELVSMVHATIRGNLRCSGGEFGNCPSDGAALTAAGVDIAGSVLLDNNFRASGTVSLDGATISGDLACPGGRFINPAGHALAVRGAKITGVVSLTDDFEAMGEVSLRSTSISRGLQCWRARFTNRQGCALRLDGAQVGNDVVLASGFKAIGEVSLKGAKISGDLVVAAASSLVRAMTAPPFSP